jgi:hypothetical protein
MNNNQKLNIDNNQNTPKQSKPMKAPKKTSAMT